MNRFLNGAAWLLLLLIAAGIAGLGYLVYRMVENTVSVIDRTWGATFYLIAAGASLLAFVVVVIGGSVSLVLHLARRSRYVHARDGMFPVRARGALVRRLLCFGCCN